MYCMNVIINVYETEKDKINTKNGSSHQTFINQGKVQMMTFCACSHGFSVTRARTFDRAGAGGGAGGSTYASWNDNERSGTQRRRAIFLALVGVMPSSALELYGGGGGGLCFVLRWRL
jgi:predicted ribosomally synthesized peptide with SipW-like signal peptide